MAKHKFTIDLDEEAYKLIMDAVGKAAFEGIKLPIRAVILGAIKESTSDKLLKAAKKQIAKEEKE